MPNEIKNQIPLLDNDGNITKTGYAKKPLPVYQRSRVRCGVLRLKEWDRYCVINDRFGVSLSISDNGYVGVDCISFMWFGEKPYHITKRHSRPFPLGMTGLPRSSDHGISQITENGYRLRFEVKDGKRVLKAHMDKFMGDQPVDVLITLTDEPEESVVLTAPFGKTRQFCYLRRINCMRAAGTVTFGNEVYEFKKEDSFARLEWMRGSLPYKTARYCGAASNGDLGFCIGNGFGASGVVENMLFYSGKCHKIGNISVENAISSDPMMPSEFKSDDGRLVLSFTPIMEKNLKTDVGIYKNASYQVFGKFNGYAVLDDGTKEDISEMFGYVEKAEYKW